VALNGFGIVNISINIVPVKKKEIEIIDLPYSVVE